MQCLSFSCKQCDPKPLECVSVCMMCIMCTKSMAQVDRVRDICRVSFLLCCRLNWQTARETQICICLLDPMHTLCTRYHILLCVLTEWLTDCLVAYWLSSKRNKNHWLWISNEKRPPLCIADKLLLLLLMLLIALSLLFSNWNDLRRKEKHTLTFDDPCSKKIGAHVDRSVREISYSIICTHVYTNINAYMACCIILNMHRRSFCPHWNAQCLAAAPSKLCMRILLRVNSLSFAG